MEQKPRQAKFIQMRTRMDYGTETQTSKVYVDKNKNGSWNRHLLGTIVLWISILDHNLNY